MTENEELEFTLDYLDKLGIDVSAEPSLQRLLHLQAQQRELWHKSNRIQGEKQMHDTQLLEIELRQTGIQTTKKNLKLQQDNIQAKEKDLQMQLQEEVEQYGEHTAKQIASRGQCTEDKEISEYQVTQETLKFEHNEIVEQANELKENQQTLQNDQQELIKILNENESQQKALQKLLQGVIEKFDELQTKRQMVQTQLQEAREQLNEKEAKLKSIDKQRKLHVMLEKVKEESRGLESLEQRLMEESSNLEAKKLAAGQKANEIESEQQNAWGKLQEVQTSLSKEIEVMHKTNQEKDPQARDDGQGERQERGIRLSPNEKMIQKYTGGFVSVMDPVMQTLDDAVDSFFEGGACG